MSETGGRGEHRDSGNKRRGREGVEEPFCTLVEVTSRAEVTLRHLCRGETSLLPIALLEAKGSGEAPPDI